MKTLKLVIVISILVLVVSLSSLFLAGCDGEPLAEYNGEPINLVNQSSAYDHTWEKLANWLKKDKTDEDYYSEERGTIYFAEKLHNRAEYDRIRTAVVIVEFDGGYSEALNAFNTVDYGLVYIDCTGPTDLWNLPQGMSFEFKYENQDESYSQKFKTMLRHIGLTQTTYVVEAPSSPSSWDKVVFLKEGERMGFIGIECGELEFDYYWYIEKTRSININSYLDDYEYLKNQVAEHVNHFNDWFNSIGKNVLLSELYNIEEWRDIRDERQELDVALNYVGHSLTLEQVYSDYRWRELGKVVNIEIIW